jgi:hypothetical protein
MPTEQPLAVPTTFFEATAPRLSKWQREYLAFRRLLPDLLRTHLGQYVAIHEGRVVGSGPEDIALIQQVHARYGYVPIHVELVNEQTSSARIPHYREVRPTEST